MGPSRLSSGRSWAGEGSDVHLSKWGIAGGSQDEMLAWTARGYRGEKPGRESTTTNETNYGYTHDVD